MTKNQHITNEPEYQTQKRPSTHKKPTISIAGNEIRAEKAYGGKATRERLEYQLNCNESTTSCTEHTQCIQIS